MPLRRHTPPRRPKPARGPKPDAVLARWTDYGQLALVDLQRLLALRLGPRRPVSSDGRARTREHALAALVALDLSRAVHRRPAALTRAELALLAAGGPALGLPQAVNDGGVRREWDPAAGGWRDAGTPVGDETLVLDDAPAGDPDALPVVLPDLATAVRHVVALLHPALPSCQRDQVATEAELRAGPPCRLATVEAFRTGFGTLAFCAGHADLWRNECALLATPDARGERRAHSLGPTRHAALVRHVEGLALLVSAGAGAAAPAVPAGKAAPVAPKAATRSSYVVAHARGCPALVRGGGLCVCAAGGEARS